MSRDIASLFLQRFNVTTDSPNYGAFLAAGQGLARIAHSLGANPFQPDLTAQLCSELVPLLNSTNNIFFVSISAFFELSSLALRRQDFDGYRDARARVRRMVASPPIHMRILSLLVERMPDSPRDTFPDPRVVVGFLTSVVRFLLDLPVPEPVLARLRADDAARERSGSMMTTTQALAQHQAATAASLLGNNQGSQENVVIAEPLPPSRQTLPESVVAERPHLPSSPLFPPAPAAALPLLPSPKNKKEKFFAPQNSIEKAIRDAAVRERESAIHARVLTSPSSSTPLPSLQGNTDVPASSSANKGSTANKHRPALISSGPCAPRPPSRWPTLEADSGSPGNGGSTPRACMRLGKEGLTTCRACARLAPSRRHHTANPPRKRPASPPRSPSSATPTSSSSSTRRKLDPSSNARPPPRPPQPPEPPEPPQQLPPSRDPNEVLRLFLEALDAKFGTPGSIPLEVVICASDPSILQALVIRQSDLPGLLLPLVLEEARRVDDGLVHKDSLQIFIRFFGTPSWAFLGPLARFIKEAVSDHETHVRASAGSAVPEWVHLVGRDRMSFARWNHAKAIVIYKDGRAVFVAISSGNFSSLDADDSANRDHVLLLIPSPAAAASPTGGLCDVLAKKLELEAALDEDTANGSLNRSNHACLKRAGERAEVVATVGLVDGHRLPEDTDFEPEEEPTTGTAEDSDESGDMVWFDPPIALDEDSEENIDNASTKKPIRKVGGRWGSSDPLARPSREGSGGFAVPVVTSRPRTFKGDPNWVPTPIPTLPGHEVDFVGTEKQVVVAHPNKYCPGCPLCTKTSFSAAHLGYFFAKDYWNMVSSAQMPDASLDRAPRLQLPDLPTFQASLAESLAKDTSISVIEYFQQLHSNLVSTHGIPDGVVIRIMDSKEFSPRLFNLLDYLIDNVAPSDLDLIVNTITAFKGSGAVHLRKLAQFASAGGVSHSSPMDPALWNALTDEQRTKFRIESNDHKKLLIIFLKSALNSLLDGLPLLTHFGSHNLQAPHRPPCHGADLSIVAYSESLLSALKTSSTSTSLTKELTAAIAAAKQLVQRVSTPQPVSREISTPLGIQRHRFRLEALWDTLLVLDAALHPPIAWTESELRKKCAETWLRRLSLGKDFLRPGMDMEALSHTLYYVRDMCTKESTRLPSEDEQRLLKPFWERNKDLLEMNRMRPRKWGWD